MVLKLGSRGAEVEAWQRFLNDQGLGPLDADGDFGPVTRDVTRAFQRAQELADDGAVGPRTLAAAGLLGFAPGPARRDVWHPPSESPPPSAVNAGPLFGDRFSRVLASAEERVGAEPAHVLTVLGLESGLDPHVENDQGARGLWQRLAWKGPRGERILYAEEDPANQLADALVFWRAQMATFRVTRFPSLEHFYCLNLAPARLAGDVAAPGTVLYDQRLHPRSYLANRGLDPPLKEAVPGCFVGPKGERDEGVPRKGQILLADLGPPLRKAGSRFAERIRRELEEASVVSRGSGTA
jgi:hypothetical protein